MATSQSLDHFVVPIDDIVAAKDFYGRVVDDILGKRNEWNVLGFEVQRQSASLKQATLKTTRGKMLILTEAPFSPKGLVMSCKVPGPHIAFSIPRANRTAAIEHLEKLGIENGGRGAAKERVDGQGGTYMDDPAGYVIQFITDGMQ